MAEKTEEPAVVEKEVAVVERRRGCSGCGVAIVLLVLVVGAAAWFWRGRIFGEGGWLDRAANQPPKETARELREALARTTQEVEQDTEQWREEEASAYLQKMRRRLEDLQTRMPDIDKQDLKTRLEAIRTDLNETRQHVSQKLAKRWDELTELSEQALREADQKTEALSERVSRLTGAVRSLELDTASQDEPSTGTTPQPSP